MEKLVLVTGGAGFIASHCIIKLLEAGYKVRATLRSLQQEPAIRAVLKNEHIQFVQADLTNDTGWAAAISGCTYILHVASPTPSNTAKTEEDFIAPARDGVLRILKHARDAGVTRVVLTSAFGAIAFGQKKSTPYTENDWTDINKNIPYYQKSKTIAEKAAWDFIAKEGNRLELSVVNPTAVLGPVLSGDYSHSIQIIHKMLNGKVSGCPKIGMAYVDVRDVADLHIKAMTNPAAKNERFLAVAGESISMLDIANTLRARLGNAASKVPTKEIPNWLLRIIGLFNEQVKLLIPHLGTKRASNEKARRLLNWTPISNEDAIAATGESLIRLGLVK